MRALPAPTGRPLENATSVIPYVAVVRVRSTGPLREVAVHPSAFAILRWVKAVIAGRPWIARRSEAEYGWNVPFGTNAWANAVASP